MMTDSIISSTITIVSSIIMMVVNTPVEEGIIVRWL